MPAFLDLFVYLFTVCVYKCESVEAGEQLWMLTLSFHCLDDGTQVTRLAKQELLFLEPSLWPLCRFYERVSARHGDVCL